MILGTVQPHKNFEFRETPRHAMPLKVSAACTIVCLGTYGSRAPASPAPSHDTSFGYGRRVLRICMNMLKFVWRCFFCAVWLAGWRVLDAGAGLRELRVAGSGYRFVPTPVSGALVLDFILPISRVRVHSA